MGAKPIATNCVNLKQFYFLDETTGDPIDGTFAAGNFTTEPIEVNHGGVWQVQAGSNGAEGSITLQQSADNEFWDDLPNSTGITLPLDDSVTFEDEFISGRFLRVVYSETTAGDVSLILTEKS